jgi:hypothetical protein
MYMRSGDIGSEKVVVVCAVTGETLATVIALDTDRGYVDMYRLDGNGRVEHGKTVELPAKRLVFPLVIERHYRPFDLVNRDTGEVLAEGG